MLTFRTSPDAPNKFGGEARQKFDSKFALDEDPCFEGRPLPLEYRPVTKLSKFEVFDSASRLVLSGQF